MHLFTKSLLKPRDFLEIESLIQLVFLHKGKKKKETFSLISFPEDMIINQGGTKDPGSSALPYYKIRHATASPHPNPTAHLFLTLYILLSP